MYAENVLLQKNVCSKQVRDYFLVYSSLLKLLMFFYEKCVFRASRRLLFSLFIYCSTSKNESLKQAGFCFLVCSSAVLLRKMCIQCKQGRHFYLIHHQSNALCSTTKNACSKQAGGFFLVYSSLISIISLMWKA